jgi:hypothetical protein
VALLDTIDLVPEVALVISADGGRALRELAETLSYELARQDVVCSVHAGAFPDVMPQRVCVLLDPWAVVGAEGPAKLSTDAMHRTVAVCTEPVPEPRDEWLELLAHAGAVFVLDQRAGVALERHGIRARLLRPGYSERLDRFDPAAARPIDVVFGPRQTGRQREYLAAAAAMLRRFECHELDDGDGDRLSLLARAKVLIDVHAGDDARLDWRLTVDAMHAGAVVLSEHSSQIAPLVAGEQLLVAAPEALPYLARAILDDEPRLARLRAGAYERLRSWLPYALPVSILRAAVVELVGQPVASPAGVSVGRGG